MAFTNIVTAGGSLGSTVEVAEIETLANGTIIIGDGSGAPTTLAAFDTSTGSLKIANGGTGQTTAADAFTALKQAATDSATGVVELAIASEVNTGTDATRAVTPDALAGSVMGSRSVEIVVFDYATNTATGDGAAYFRVPEELNGMNLISVYANVISAGTTGTTDIQIARQRPASASTFTTVDMLSTKITIDSGELGSQDAAAAVIDTSNDDVATNDRLRIDVDAVSTTPAAGLMVTMRFQLP